MPDPENFRLMPWGEPEKLAYHIGRLTIQWNDVQFWFFVTFTRMLPDTRAESVFFAVRTDRAQRDMVRDLADHVLADELELLAELKARIEEANQFAGRRNDVLHAMWDFGPGGDKARVHFPAKSRLSGKDVIPEIEQIHQSLARLEATLPDLTHRIGTVLKAKSAEAARRHVAEAFARGLQPPAPDPKPKGAGRRNGRKGNRQQS